MPVVWVGLLSFTGKERSLTFHRSSFWPVFPDRRLKYSSKSSQYPACLKKNPDITISWIGALGTIHISYGERVQDIALATIVDRGRAQHRIWLVTVHEPAQDNQGVNVIPSCSEGQQVLVPLRP